MIETTEATARASEARVTANMEKAEEAARAVTERPTENEEAAPQRLRVLPRTKRCGPNDYAVYREQEAARAATARATENERLGQGCSEVKEFASHQLLLRKQLAAGRQ